MAESGSSLYRKWVLRGERPREAAVLYHTNSINRRLEGGVHLQVIPTYRKHIYLHPLSLPAAAFASKTQCGLTTHVFILSHAEKAVELITYPVTVLDEAAAITKGSPVPNPYQQYIGIDILQRDRQSLPIQDGPGGDIDI